MAEEARAGPERGVAAPKSFFMASRRWHLLTSPGDLLFRGERWTNDGRCVRGDGNFIFTRRPWKPRVEAWLKTEFLAGRRGGASEPGGGKGRRVFEVFLETGTARLFLPAKAFGKRFRTRTLQSVGDPPATTSHAQDWLQLAALASFFPCDSRVAAARPAFLVGEGKAPLNRNKVLAGGAVTVTRQVRNQPIIAAALFWPLSPADVIARVEEYSGRPPLKACAAYALTKLETRDGSSGHTKYGPSGNGHNVSTDFM